MKKIYCFLSILFLISSSCNAQEAGWLHNNIEEFEKIFPYFDTIIKNSDYFKKKFTFQEVEIPDTLSIGTWVGSFLDAVYAGDDVTLKITETFPIIKGFVHTKSYITDYGEGHNNNGNSRLDSDWSELRGIKKGNQYLIVFEDQGNLYFLEGRCFRDKLSTYSRRLIIMGNFEWVSLKRRIGSKGNFKLEEK